MRFNNSARDIRVWGMASANVVKLLCSNVFYHNNGSFLFHFKMKAQEGWKWRTAVESSFVFRIKCKTFCRCVRTKMLFLFTSHKSLTELVAELIKLLKAFSWGAAKRKVIYSRIELIFGARPDFGEWFLYVFYFMDFLGSFYALRLVFKFTRLLEATYLVQCWQSFLKQCLSTIL